jgi:hypothetical protein
MANKLKYTSVDALNAQIEAYFEDVKVREVLPTYGGLSLYLGFSDVSSLRDYGEKPAYAPSIKKAKSRITALIEERLISGKPPIGLIFWLKNNAGWQDKQELDMTTNGKDIGVVQLPARLPSLPA